MNVSRLHFSMLPHLPIALLMKLCAVQHASGYQTHDCRWVPLLGYYIQLLAWVHHYSVHFHYQNRSINCNTGQAAWVHVLETRVVRVHSKMVVFQPTHTELKSAKSLQAPPIRWGVGGGGGDGGYLERGPKANWLLAIDEFVL